MSLRVNASNLGTAAKDLMIEWQHAKASWSDAKSAEFEGTYLDSIPSQLARAVTVIEELDTLLRKVRSACE